MAPNEADPHGGVHLGSRPRKATLPSAKPSLILRPKGTPPWESRHWGGHAGPWKT